MHVTAIEGTDLFTGTQEAPLQVVRVTLTAGAADAGRRLSLAGEDVITPEPVVVPGPGEHALEVPVSTSAGAGTLLRARLLADGEPVDGAPEASFAAAETGWTMHMVSHFHYDPVWWNTQAAYTSEWDVLDFDGSPRADFQQSGFTLVQAHLELARQDPDYRFVLAEVDYLKPYWDVFPADRAYLRRLMAEDRLEIMGGTWNEPSSNLTGAELTIRNAVYGVGFQRDVLGGDPQSAWQLDVFGHDPQFPGIMHDAGLTSSSWARGPFHQWGPMLTRWDSPAGDATVMQFPAEFEWLSPSGRGVLTAYMANHYSAGWAMDSAPTLEAAMAAAYQVFAGLKPVAATRNVLLPVGTDYTPPNRWVTRIQREWNARYVWPRFTCALPRHFFAAVRAELAARGIEPSPQSRDMNPLYTGKDVSYIDTKQAQREAEIVLQEAETWATVAALSGAAYPDELLDKAWRQLVYGAHHDGITGSESDQVYLDLLAGWREARDLAHQARGEATSWLAGLIGVEGAGWAVTVFNALSWERSEIAAVRCDLTGTPVHGLRLHDASGAEVPFTAEGIVRGGDGTITSATLHFLATGLPSVGHRTWLLVPAGDLPAGSAWAPGDGVTIETSAYRVTADPARGGGLAGIVEKATGRQLLADGGTGNELVVYEEYPDHPQFREGPWHLVPKGTSAGSAAAPARSLVRETSALGERLVATGQVGPCTYTQVTTLWHGADRVDFTTWVDAWEGSDQLLRARFPLPADGGLPVSEVAHAVIGRGFGFPDSDVAEEPWTLDNPAHLWFGLSATALVALHDSGGGTAGPLRAIGVADVVVPEEDRAAELARDLVVALVRAGVTATTSSAHGPRYGLLSVDSNLPDFRITVGGPDVNDFTAAVLHRAGEAYRAEVGRQLAATGRARVWVPAATPLAQVWVPNADLTAPGALPVLVIAGQDEAALADELAAVAGDLADARVDVVQPAELHPPADHERWGGHTVALLNRGTPGFVVDTRGTLHLSLLRSCTGWPSGVWIDPPARTAPDGSGFQLQHWTHRFDYALASGEGDWRRSRMVQQGRSFNHVPAVEVHDGSGDRPGERSVLRIEPETVALSALKGSGNPLSHGETRPPRPRERLTLRLYETAGSAASVTVAAEVPLRDAARTDLLEARVHEPVDATSGALHLPLDGAGIVTVTARPDVPGEVTAAAEPSRDRPVEYARYWLHNRGVAPAGAHPVAVHVHGPHRIDGPAPLRIVVASGLTKEPWSGDVTVTVPPGWAAPSAVPVEVGPGGHAEHEITVTPPPDGRGLHLLRVGLTGPSGHRTEDVLTVRLGDDAAPRVLEASLAGDAFALAPGTDGDVVVRLGNRAHGDLDAEVQLLTPYGTWEIAPRWARHVTVPGEGTAEHRIRLSVPADARPGRWWALVKVMAAGEIVYTRAVVLEVVAAGSPESPGSPA